MKNRLAFGSFHSQHFSVHQVQEWKYLLRNQLYPPDWIASQYPHGNCEDYQELEQVSCDRHNVMQEKEQCDEAKESVVENEQQVSNGLSKEAIEIFRHSEAYRKERQTLDEKMDAEEDHDDDNFISSALHRNGVEVSARHLVLLKKDHTFSLSDETRMQERLLDANYLKSCQTTKEAVVLWPVLPIRL